MRGAAEDDGPIHEGANGSANGSAKDGADDRANDGASERVNQAESASGGASRAGRARRARRDGWTAHRRGLFLDTLRATLNVRAAARAAQMSAQTAHDLRRRDPDFARAWAGALDDGAAEMEFRLLECGMFGVETEEVVTETGPITRADGTVGESRRIVRVTRTVPVAMMERLLSRSAHSVARSVARSGGRDAQDARAVLMQGHPAAGLKAQIDAIRARIGRPPLLLTDRSGDRAGANAGDSGPEDRDA